MGMSTAGRLVPLLAAAVFAGSLPRGASPVPVPAAPNASIVTAWVLEYRSVDPSTLGIAPGQVVYAWALCVLDSEDVPDRANFTRNYVGRVLHAYSRQPVASAARQAAVRARVAFRGDERGGHFWIEAFTVRQPGKGEPQWTDGSASCS